MMLKERQCVRYGSGRAVVFFDAKTRYKVVSDKGVTRELQGSYKVVTRWLQGGYKVVTRPVTR